jgi:tetrapyrrole methylase family protein/MazG family protein
VTLRRNFSKRKQKRASPKRTASRATIPVTARDRRAGAHFAKLVALQSRLLGPGGCPWDREQTHFSLRKYLIEETYEVLEALESGDDAEFSSELGDLLLQIVFHSRLAEQDRRFSIDDVIEAICTKMVRRHPHVFSDVKASDSKAVLKKWEEIKANERAEKKAGAKPRATPESILGDVPRALPAVLEAYQLTRKASLVGFDWDNLQGIFEKLQEERHELEELTGSASQTTTDSHRKLEHSGRIEEEVGDLLFSAANVARFVGVDPELALKTANRKFRERFEWMEQTADRKGLRFADLQRDRMEELWNEAKRAPRNSSRRSVI